MAHTIKIFNPNDKLYGELSNNYPHWMSINVGLAAGNFADNIKRFPTVTNFIYSSLLITPKYRDQLQFIKYNKITQEYQHLRQKEYHHIFQQALEKSYQKKIVDNRILQDKLLATGNAPLLFQSNDSLLGGGVDRNGMNLVGKYLMQIRQQLLYTYKVQEQTKLQVDRDLAIYEAYVVYHALENAIQEGDDLQEYIGLTPADVLNILGRSELLHKAPQQELIQQLETQNQLEPAILLSLENTASLVGVLRKKYLRKVPQILQHKKYSIIFNMYAEYLLDKRYPDLPKNLYKQAIQQQTDSISFNVLKEIEKRVYELYEKGMLSENLSNNIDQQIASIKIPSEQEVIVAEAFKIEDQDAKMVNHIPYLPPSGEAIIIYPVNEPLETEQQVEYSVFSPTDHSVLISLHGYLFPSVIHYCLFMLIVSIPTIKTFPKAYKFLLADPTLPVENISNFLKEDTIMERYIQLYNNYYSERITALMQEGLNVKFENRNFQNVLLSTKNANLIWNNFSEPILGVGPEKDGQNLVGQYLMQLRQEFQGERSDETIQKLSLEEITKLIEQDPILKVWIQMRLTDMCNVIILLRKYMVSQINKEVILNEKLIENILNIIYQPCSHIFALISEINVSVPDFFTIMVHTNPEFVNASDKIIRVLWDYLAVMLHYLIEYIGGADVYNIRKILSQLQTVITKSNKCVFLLDDEEDNCIASALLNLLEGLIQLNKVYNIQSVISQKEIELITSIILTKSGKDLELVLSETDDETSISLDPEPEVEIELNVGTDLELDEELYPPSEEDLDEEIDGYGEFDEDIFSPPSNNLRLATMLSEIIGSTSHIDDVLIYVEKAIKLIKSYPMAKYIKTNRVNFFATQR